MPRMRLISDAFNEIKKDDPNTAITLSGLRNLVRQGKIPCAKIGRKTLINYDALIEYLSVNIYHHVKLKSIRNLALFIQCQSLYYKP